MLEYDNMEPGKAYTVDAWMVDENDVPLSGVKQVTLVPKEPSGKIDIDIRVLTENLKDVESVDVATTIKAATE